MQMPRRRREAQAPRATGGSAPCRMVPKGVKGVWLGRGRRRSWLGCLTEVLGVSLLVSRWVGRDLDGRAGEADRLVD
jgi:hypothetical protein